MRANVTKYTMYFNFQLNRIYNNFLDLDWFSACLFVIVTGPSGNEFRE